MEEWKDIEGYPNYQVSNMGRVKSLNYNHTGKERMMKFSDNGHGYLRVRLCKEGKAKHFLVHRLVAIAFIPNPNNLPCVNHKNEIKTDNRVENLEWCTYEYNINYGTRSVRASKSRKGKYCGKNSPNYGKTFSEKHKQKISENHANKKSVICITTNVVFSTVKEASEYYNINKGNLVQCCKGNKNYNYCGKYNGQKLIFRYLTIIPL